jgi:hypothetical protein
MHRYRWLVGAAAGLVLAGGCDEIGPIACGGESAPYLVLEVRDAHTNMPAARGASGLARDGRSFTDELRPLGDLEMYPTTTARPGTYDVVVTKAGYQTWRAHDVHVREGTCGVRTVQLRVRLEPLAGRSETADR